MLKIQFNPTKKTRRWMLIAIFLLVLAGIGIITNPVLAANTKDIVSEILAWALFGILSFLGKLVVVVIDIMLKVASFNNFNDIYGVTRGWTIVRDICNLFLIVILLIIAWGTVLRIESYHYKRALPKFIIFAFLINFSRTITCFFIDIAQVIMMTFVNAFRDAAAGNIIVGTNLQNILRLSDASTSGGMGAFEVIGAFMLGLILVGGLLGVTLMLLIILVGRIVSLWILIVLSPLAYLGEAMPTLRRLASNWWSYFGQYLVVGPIVAFFLWLSMAIIQHNAGDIQQEIQLGPQEVAEKFQEHDSSENALAAAISEAAKSDNLINYILTVGLLYASTMLAGQFKVIGAAYGVSMARGISSRVTKGVAAAPFKGYGWVARKYSAGKVPKWLGGQVLKGLPLNPVEVYRNIKEGMKIKRSEEDFDRRMEAEARLMKGGLLAPIAGAAAPSLVTTYFRGFGYSHGWKTLIHKGVLAKKDKDLKEGEERLTGADEKVKGLEHDISADTAHAFEYVKRRREIAERTGKDETSEEVNEQVRKELAAKYGGDEYRHNVNERDRIKREIDAMKLSIAQWEGYAPRDIMLQQMRRAKDEEERKKYPTNIYEEINDNIRGAVARGDANAVRGLLLQAAKVGHENEACMYALPSTTTWYHHSGDKERGIEARGVMDEDEFNAYTAGMSPKDIQRQFHNKGKPLVREGEYFGYDQMHFTAFMRDVMMNRLHQDAQTTYGLQSDISRIAYETGHHQIIEGVGTKRGKFFARDYIDQQTRAGIEIGKMDLENTQRRTNRLSPCGEYHKDPTKPELGRDARLSPMGVKNFVDKWPAIASLIGKDRYNESRAFHLVKSNLHLLTGPMREMTRQMLMEEAKSRAFLERFLRDKDTSKELKEKYMTKEGKLVAGKESEFARKFVDIRLEQYDGAIVKLQQFASTQPGDEAPDEFARTEEIRKTIDEFEKRRSVTSET